MTSWRSILAPAVLLTAIYCGVQAFETDGGGLVWAWALACGLMCVTFSAMVGRRDRE